jgi:hypothetical protein
VATFQKAAKMVYSNYDLCIQPCGVQTRCYRTGCRDGNGNRSFDELIEGYDNKYLLIGFDMSGSLIEVMYNLVDEDIANIFHAMSCRNDVLRTLRERGYYADFN